MCLTSTQLSEPDDTDLHLKNMKDIKFRDRNIMGKCRKILTEIELRLDELRQDFPAEDL